MSLLSRVTAASGAALVLGIGLAGGCSSDAGGAPGGDGGANGTGSTGTGAGNQINFKDSGSDGDISTFDAGPDGGCDGVKAEVELTPVNLIIVVDKSGSMGAPGQSQPGDIDKRWNPMVTAFSQFFNTVTSPALKASFTFFPAPCELDLNANGGCVCKADEYNPDKVAANTNSSVPLTQIFGHAQTFVSMLNDNQPNGGTPTIAALQGSYAYASAAQAAAPKGTTYVVLITDGSPGFGYCPLADGCADGGAIGVAGCPGNDITTIQSLAQSYASQGIKTYVFGMGGIANLDRIATAGGTSLVTINVGDPGTTTQSFINNLNQIPKPVFDCEYPIPPNPDIKLDKVNVFYTNDKSTDGHLIYNNPNCARGDNTGWYVSGNDIVLCQKTCDQLRTDPSSALSVQFNCPTQPFPQ